MPKQRIANNPDGMAHHYNTEDFSYSPWTRHYTCLKCGSVVNVDEERFMYLHLQFHAMLAVYGLETNKKLQIIELERKTNG